MLAELANIDRPCITCGTVLLPIVLDDGEIADVCPNCIADS